MPNIRAVLCACWLALTLAACSEAPLGRDVVAQARPQGQVAFDLVKIDDAVVATLAARPRPEFPERFKKYEPPPDITIGVGDTVGVVIWESGSEGLFGNSLTELSFPAGVSAGLQLEPLPTLSGVPSLPIGMAPSPDVVAQLFAGSAAQNLAAAAAGAGALSNLSSRRLEQLIDLATQTGRPGTRIPDQQVGSDGAISVPYAGRIAVAGRTPAEAQHRIERLLASKALDPQALVVVDKSDANTVTVTGELVGGALVPLSPGGERLLQVIVAAGAKTPLKEALLQVASSTTAAGTPPQDTTSPAAVHDLFVRLSRDGVTATVPLATLVADPQENIFARPGDIVTLVKRPNTYSVFGATGKNAAITFTSEHMSLAEALAKAGGLRDERADPRAVFLFRYEPLKVVRALGQPVAADASQGVSPIAYRLDLSDAKSYLLAKRFPVRDKDIIFVADAATQPIYQFFQVLTQITGPIQTGIITCSNLTNC